MDIDELEDSIRNEPVWTVVGFWLESLERWMGYYYASSARMAEDMAQAEAAEQGLRLGVVGVFEGELKSSDQYATYVDPDAVSSKDMDAKLREWGFLPVDPVQKQETKKKFWQS